MIEGWLYWLTTTSLKASLLVIAAFSVTFLFRKSLPPRWRYAVWLLLLLRLCLPLLPKSEVSVFQAGEIAMQGAWHRAAKTQVTELGAQPIAPSATVEAGRGGAVADLDVATLLALVWLAGALAVVVRSSVAMARFRIGLRRARPVGTAEVGSEVKRKLGVKTEVRVVESELVETPALFGLFRPRIVLPTGALKELPEDELRFVLFHELAHVKRRDPWVQYLTSLLAAVHWWNPLVLLGFRQLRAERELACDDLVLRHLSAEERRGYGQTLLNVLDRSLRPQKAPVLAMAESKLELGRRLLVIRDGAPRGVGHNALALALVLGLGVVALTDALPTNGDDRDAAKVTITLMRNVGTAAVAWVEDQSLPERSQDSASGDDSKPIFDWSDCPAISYGELVERLVPKYLEELPVADGWDTAFEYCLADAETAPYRYALGIRSAGADGAFSGTTYEPGAFPIGKSDNDIVWADGYFVRWPTASDRADKSRGPTVDVAVNGKPLSFQVLTPRPVYEIESVATSDGEVIRIHSDSASAGDHLILKGLVGGTEDTSHIVIDPETSDRTVRFSAWLKSESLNGQGFLVLQRHFAATTPPPGATRPSDTVHSEPAHGDEPWTLHSLEASLPAGTAGLQVGVIMAGGSGTLEVRDLRFEVLESAER